MHPPQIYTFSRLCNINQLDELKDFALSREKQGLQVTMPIQIRCNDGLAFVLPGDGEYPDQPNYAEPAESSDRESSKDLSDFRQSVKNIHRFEIRGPNDLKLYMNIKPINGHLAPVLEAKL